MAGRERPRSPPGQPPPLRALRRAASRRRVGCGRTGRARGRGRRPSPGPCLRRRHRRSHGGAAPHEPGGPRRVEPAAQIWAQLGWSSIAISLRGHGDAEGERLDYGLVAAGRGRGGRLARGRFEGPVVVHGVSLGAAAAARCGVLDPRGRLRARSALHLDRRRDPRQDHHAAPTGARPPGSFESPRSRAAVPPWSHRERPAPRSVDRPGLPSFYSPAPSIGALRSRGCADSLEVLGPATRLEIAAVAHAAWQSRPDLLEPALRRWVEASGL